MYEGSERCIYVGSSVDPRRRFVGHRGLLRHGIHESLVLQNVWNKEGEQAMTVVLLESCPKEEIREREQNWIDFYSHAYGPACLMNIVKKVDSTYHRPVLDRVAQLSEIGKERWSGEGNPFHDVHRTGDSNPFYGRKHSEETRQKLSEAAKARAARGDVYWKGKHHTASARQKIRMARLGTKLSEEAKRAISERQLGRPLPSLYKPVAQIDTDTRQILRVFESTTRATRETGVDGTSISRVARGTLSKGRRNLTAGGFVWRFVDKDGHLIEPSSTTKPTS